MPKFLNMRIKSIELNNYRNYEKVVLDNFIQLNILQGLNASGKTNFIESIVLSSLGKSMRAVKDKELIRFGCDNAYIRIEVEKQYRKHLIEMFLDGKNKRIAVDKLPISKISDLMGVMNIVYFSPDELRLIKDAPADRRRFIDISLCQQSKLYFKTLSSYNNNLLQRNKLLKSGMSKENIMETLPIWNRELAKDAAYIVQQRLKFTSSLRVYALECHTYLTSDRERLSIEYERETKSESYDEMVTEYVKLFDTSSEKDIELRYTSSGPHRDDIKFSINGVDVRKYGSQGQQRTTALALKLAEVKIMELSIGEKPILLLDDVLSELDETRINRLLVAIEGTQTFITCTEYGRKKNSGIRIYSVTCARDDSASTITMEN